MLIRGLSETTSGPHRAYLPFITHHYLSTAAATSTDRSISSQNLLENLVGSIQDGTSTAQNIQWGSTGPNGLCCFLLNSDQSV
jgi:hypothetical protein